MLSRNEVKYIQSLYHKKQRDANGLFIAEGTKLLQELLRSDYTIRKVYCTDEGMTGFPVNIEVVNVSEDELKRISRLDAPNRVMAVVEKRPQERQCLDKDSLSLVLDGIQDPGNLGTLVRIADWFGIKQVICSEDTAELYNPKVIQSTMGSFVRVNVWYETLPALLANAGCDIFGALLTGADIHYVGKPVKGLLVIGNESRGIREETLQYISHPVTIPRRGGAESLNAAVAAGIILSHLL